MNVLIVGAGAVGQVYGLHLSRGGAHVRYFVRERHAEECRRGFAFYPLNRRKPRREPVRTAVAASDILTGLDEVQAVTWDQVYLCMASHALRGRWLGELAARIGAATVVSLQPGADDRAVVLESVPFDRVVSGMITLISYPAPLDGETVPEPGMAYWFPPLAPAPFSGPEERTRAVVAALRAGGLPCKRDKDVPAKVTAPTGLLMALLTALEASGWSFRELARGPHLARARLASAETFAILEHASGARTPLVVRLLSRPFWIRRGLALARWAMPLDAEAYFRAHFTKVREQTRMFMRAYIDQGTKLGLSTTALSELERSVAQDPASRTG
jgi:2-dehydropantoate 2-reductase